ncbi:MAG: hypothetical protein ACTHNW_15650 [Mucilaginibacter sp.]
MLAKAFALMLRAPQHDNRTFITRKRRDCHVVALAQPCALLAMTQQDKNLFTKPLENQNKLRTFAVPKSGIKDFKKKQEECLLFSN